MSLMLLRHMSIILKCMGCVDASLKFYKISPFPLTKMSFAKVGLGHRHLLHEVSPHPTGFQQRQSNQVDCIYTSKWHKSEWPKSS